MPTHGILRLTYCSGDGSHKDGFDVSVECRKALTYLTTLNEEYMIPLNDRLQVLQIINNQMSDVTDETATSPINIYNVYKRLKPSTTSSNDIPLEDNTNTIQLLPGMKFIERKLDLFKKYLSVNDVKAANEFARSGKNKETNEGNSKKPDKKKKK